MLGFRQNHEQGHLVLNIVAYLVVGEEPAGAGEFARLSTSVGLPSPIISYLRTNVYMLHRKERNRKYGRL